MYITKDFEPRRVLNHFEDICAIPHGTDHEEALGDHIMRIAAARGYQADRDKWGNVLVNVPATPGCEHVPPFLLQGHLDMVLNKEVELERDMLTEPIHLVVEGNILRADRTTLGSDNAVGLCNMMALMDADDLRHPPLELLFTTREETGLHGIRGFDMSKIRSRRMINMDMGDPDCIVIGSAGNAKFDLEKKCEHSACTDDVLEIFISGLRGGHGGLMIGKNHVSALHLIGRVLGQLCDTQPVRLQRMLIPSYLSTGIPETVKMMVAVPDVKAAKELLQETAEAFRRELHEEPEFAMTVTDAAKGDAASAEDTRALADFMVMVPYEVAIRNTQHPEWVLSSSLMTAADYENGFFTGLWSIRANRDEYFDATRIRLETLCRMTGMSAKMRDEWIPAWPETVDTPMQILCRDTFRELFGGEMTQEVEHGTVEVSVIAKAIPDMDIVGFAPKSRGAHTVHEHLFLDSMEPFWRHLTTILSKLCDEK